MKLELPKTGRYLRQVFIEGAHHIFWYIETNILIETGFYSEICGIPAKVIIVMTFLSSETKTKAIFSFLSKFISLHHSFYKIYPWIYY